MGTMGKKKIKKRSPKATLAEVTIEMAKPRIAKSARGAVNVHSGVRRVALSAVKRRTKQATGEGSQRSQWNGMGGAVAGQFLNCSGPSRGNRFRISDSACSQSSTA